MADSSDLVGFIVGEQEGQGGWYIYACGDHAQEALTRESSRHVLRDEAEESAATCGECGVELWEAEALDG